jgi:hypothetical protein
MLMMAVLITYVPELKSGRSTANDSLPCEPQSAGTSK